jgi:hypothetical protein
MSVDAPKRGFKKNEEGAEKQGSEARETRRRTERYLAAETARAAGSATAALSLRMRML